MVEVKADGAVQPRLMATELGDDVAFLLARVSARTSALGGRSIAPYDLNVRSYSLLALACSGESPTQRECADFLSLDPSRVVSLVDDLEKRGLVRRAPSGFDRRTKTIEPTPEGKRVFALARAATRAAEDLALGHLTSAERDRLLGDLRTAAAFQE
ncbi:MULTISPECIES: MarR family winged helix-turn-helix transcriptional regulator [unclassified Microbacterium]|uniref:MarR family winged helix-turn-helix transcriptional regulator n=1 Tax=unclassified Microbacterium TaxID=2609290 RepID=UPI003019FBD5